MTMLLDTILDRAPIEVLEKVEGVMRHADDDVRVALVCQLYGVDDLALADQQLAVIRYAPLGEPCGIETNDRQSDILDGDKSDVSESFVGPVPGLSVQVRALKA